MALVLVFFLFLVLVLWTVVLLTENLQKLTSVTIFKRSRNAFFFPSDYAFGALEVMILSKIWRCFRYVGHVLHDVREAGIGTIWLDEVLCRGSETDIGECPHLPWGIHDCGHQQDVSISCYNRSITAASTTTQSTASSDSIGNISTLRAIKTWQ